MRMSPSVLSSCLSMYRKSFQVVKDVTDAVVQHTSEVHTKNAPSTRQIHQLLCQTCRKTWRLLCVVMVVTDVVVSHISVVPTKIVHSTRGLVTRKLSLIWEYGRRWNLPMILQYAWSLTSGLAFRNSWSLSIIIMAIMTIELAFCDQHSFYCLMMYDCDLLIYCCCIIMHLNIVLIMVTLYCMCI